VRIETIRGNFVAVSFDLLNQSVKLNRSCQSLFLTLCRNPAAHLFLADIEGIHPAASRDAKGFAGFHELQQWLLNLQFDFCFHFHHYQFSKMARQVFAETIALPLSYGLIH
jgi:hypothetical protein